MKRCESIYNSNADESTMTIQCQLEDGHVGDHEFTIFDDKGNVHDIIIWNNINPEVTSFLIPTEGVKYGRMAICMGKTRYPPKTMFN